MDRRAKRREGGENLSAVDNEWRHRKYGQVRLMLQNFGGRSFQQWCTSYQDYSDVAVKIFGSSHSSQNQIHPSTPLKPFIPTADTEGKIRPHVTDAIVSQITLQ